VEYTAGLIETGTEAVVCMEETVDASGVVDGLLVNSSAAAAAAAAAGRDEERRADSATSLDTAHQTGPAISSSM